MSKRLTSDQQNILNTLSALHPFRDEQVRIPQSDETVRVIRPVNVDALLDGAMDDPEQNLPYWCELWPSGIALAGLLMQQPDLVCGKSVLELGCGLGVTAAIAMLHDADVLATDYAEESLQLTRLTCSMHTGAEPETARVNWRDPQELVLNGNRTWPVVLAADVLYERRDIEPLLQVLERVLHPNGVVLLAEPGRDPARLFLEQIHERGWDSSTTHWNGPWPDHNDVSVKVRIHQLVRGKSQEKGRL